MYMCVYIYIHMVHFPEETIGFPYLFLCFPQGTQRSRGPRQGREPLEGHRSRRGARGQAHRSRGQF